MLRRRAGIATSSDNYNSCKTHKQSDDPSHEPDLMPWHGRRDKRNVLIPWRRSIYGSAAEAGMQKRQFGRTLGIAIGSVVIGAAIGYQLPRARNQEAARQMVDAQQQLVICQRAQRELNSQSEAAKERPRPKKLVQPEYKALIDLVARPDATDEDRIELANEIADAITRHTTMFEYQLKMRILDERGIVKEPLLILRLLTKRMRARFGEAPTRRILIQEFGPMMGSLIHSIPERAAIAGLPPL